MKGEPLYLKFNTMSREEYNEYKFRRYERLGLPIFYIIEERPKDFFTEEEWIQYQKDNFEVGICILNNKPISEDVEERIMKYAVKINRYFNLVYNKMEK